MIKDIALDKLYVSPLNVRKTIDEESIVLLAASIKENGLLNPIVVRNGSRKDTFEIVAGQRRYLALKNLYEKSAKCDIRNLNDAEALSISLDENEVREEMTTKDRIRAYGDLFKILGSVKKLAENRKMSEATVRKYLSLQTLPDYILDMIDSKNGKVSLDFAEQLAKMGPNHSTYFYTLTSSMKNPERTTLAKKLNKEKFLDESTIYSIVSKSCKQPSGKIIRIPDDIYDEVVSLVESKTGIKIK